MDRIRNLLSSAMALALLSSHAYAEDKNLIALRGSVRDGATRIVMAGTVVPKYSVDAQGQKYTITFSPESNISSDIVNLSSLPRVAGYKILSPQKIEINVAAGQNIQTFVVGNKVILDIKGKADVPQAEPPKETPKEPVKQIAKVAPKADTKSISKAAVKVNEKPPVKETTKPSKSNEPLSIINTSKLPSNIVIDRATGDAEGGATTTTTATAVPAGGVTTPPPQPAKPVQISITSTSLVPLVIYKRGDYLWVAEDREGFSTPPVVTGLDAINFAPVEVKGFSMFRAKWPSSAPNLTPNGGGLVWKISNVLPAEKEGDKSTDKKSKPVELLNIAADEGKNGAELLWPVKSLHRVADFSDPDTGDVIKLAFVEDAADYIVGPRHYVEVDVLPSFVGLAFIPKTDDMTALKTADGLVLSRPKGLVLSPQKDLMASKTDQARKSADNPDDLNRKIFDFEKWRVGDKSTISENQRIIMSGLADQTDVKRAENLIALGHMMLSFGYAPEALGYFDLAESTLPDLVASPEFNAAKAVAQTLAGRSKEAFATLSASQLSNIGEIKYWKAFALADLDDWQQAATTLPSDISILSTYPIELRTRLGLQMAEICLRQGEPDKARDILDLLGKDEAKMDIGDKSNLDYLNGEYARQKGHPEESKKIWGDLVNGYDDLYRAKARFALSTLQLEGKDITIDKAIDNLEGLRYAWRGDDLETSINYNLAKLYLQKGEPMKALTMMRLAGSLIPDSEQSKKIIADLHSTFQNLFTPESIKKLTPIDAMTVYNEFGDLVPSGPEGEKISRQLAERLVDADLLPRAETLLQKQVDSDLKGIEGADVALRLASLLVLDGKPERAMSNLDKATAFLKGATTEEINPRQHDITILRAKALSMMGKPQDAFNALATLPQDASVLKMRADVAWRNKKWQDAADALEQVLGQQDISLTRPLSDEQGATILNWAVALYLADNRYVLANLRERYADSMAQTPFAKKFDVITRPRQMSLLADKDTIQSIINETDMFKDFLTSFKQDAVKSLGAAKEGATQSAAPVAPIPGAGTGVTGPVPEGLKNSPLLKTDAFSGD